ncbi:MAG TPA: hypothetical protein VJN48_02760 [Terriglobales bacterium]|nr:hypothetical protein [Terriglobales bacterium]
MGSASLGFGGLFFPVPGRSARLQQMEQASGSCGDLIHGRQESRFIGLRRLVEARNFSDKLKGSAANLLLGNRRVKVEKYSDVSAHS